MSGNGTAEPGVLGVMQQSNILDKVDGTTVIHAVVIGVVLIIAYHLLFHR